MTYTTTGWGAPAAGAPLAPVTITRRDLRADDILINIKYAGICHSDIHTVRGEWGERQYPLIPGHEIIGEVAEIGSNVTKYQVGDTVGVGCFINSCGECDPCQAHEESYCAKAPVPTYGAADRFADGEYSQGGYAKQIVVKENFVIPIPAGMDLASAAPLLCAGITTYSPLKHWGAGPGKKVAIIGMGGIGHVAVKIAAAMGAEVTAFSHSLSKKADGLAFGASAYISTADGSFLTEYAEQFDLILNTTSVNLDMNAYMGLLKFNGTMVMLGLPDEPVKVMPRTFTQRRRSIAGSLVGGTKETAEMLQFCADHKIGAEVEVIPASEINTAYDRTIASDVRYRFVIDTATI